jgi:amino acid permease
MKYALKSKFGKFVSDYGLVIMALMFTISSGFYLMTGQIITGIASLWSFLAIIMLYIDYKVEHIETENHRERDIVLAEMKQDFFKVKCMLLDLKAANPPPLE